jgi:hypothetical protein
MRLLALTLLPLLVGCLPRHSTRGDAGGGSGNDMEIRIDDLPDGVIEAPYAFLTLAPGEPFNFKGRVVCPAALAPCSTRWSFGDGRTSDLEDPGPISFPVVGFYPVTFTVTGAKGRADPTPSTVNVAVWNGEIKDDFNRPTLGWAKDGWRTPLIEVTQDPQPQPLYSIDNGWLKVVGDYNRPGSTAILAWPLVSDSHVEVTKRRQADATVEHYCDVMLRVHPSGNIVSFIRVRIWEEAASANPSLGNGIEIAVFKITRPEDEHGVLINDEIKSHEVGHTVCNPGAAYGACPYRQGVPRTENLRIVVDVTGTKITARVYALSDLTTPLLSSTATDDYGTPHLYAGAVGLTHFEGLSHFDDFLLRRVDSTVTDGPVTSKDAGLSQ